MCVFYLLFIFLTIVNNISHFSILFIYLSIYRNETFDIMVFDKETQFIDIMLYDHDIDSDDFLGQTCLSLAKIPLYTPTEYDIPLQNSTKGVLSISCEYLPLKKKVVSQLDGEENGDDIKKSERDIIFHFSPNAFTSDILEAEATSTVDANSKDENAANKSSSMSFSTAGMLVTKLKSSENTVKTKADKKEKPGVLTISHIRCRELRSTSMLSSNIKPYVIATIENNVKTTEVKSNVKDPCFEETFNFVVSDARHAVLQLRVMDEFKMLVVKQNVCLGEVYINISDITLLYGALEQEYAMVGKYDGSFLSCKVEWSSTL